MSVGGPLSTIGRVTTLAFAFTVLAMLSCVNAPVGDTCLLRGRAEPIDRNCLRIHAVETYLMDLQRHVGPVLRLPPNFNEDGYVEVRFVLNRAGSVSDRCITRSSDRQLSRSVLEALDSVSFPPIPHYARCIAGFEIRRELSTVKR